MALYDDYLNFNSPGSAYYPSYPSYFGYDDPNVVYTQRQSQQTAQANVPGKDSSDSGWGSYGEGGYTDPGSGTDFPEYYDPGAPGGYPKQPPPPSPPPPLPPPTPPPADEPPKDDTPAPPAAPPYSDAAFQAALRALPATGESTRKVIADNPSWGITVLGPKGDKVRLADGRVVDVGFSFGSGQGARWQWQDVSGAGGGGAVGGPAAYAPPPTPMVMPNGLVPPGMPYQPSAEITSAQDTLLKQILANPTFSQQYLGGLQEAQKEAILHRQQQTQRGQQQSAASRGVYRGGANTAAQRRIRNETTQQLLQSQRDTSLQTEAANRQGLLNALTTSQGIVGNRFDQSLALQRFLEAIREYGMDDLYRYAIANQNADQFYNQLLFGGGA